MATPVGWAIFMIPARDAAVMRTLSIVIAVMALLVVPAQSQMGGGKRGHKGDDTKDRRQENKSQPTRLSGGAEAPSPSRRKNTIRGLVTKSPDAKK